MNKLPEQFSLQGDWDQAKAVVIQREGATAQLANYMRDGFLSQIRTITASTTMLKSDTIVLADATAAPVVFTQLAAAQCKEKRIVLKKIDASANAVSFSANVDGAAWSTTTQYDKIEITTDGTNWYSV